MFRKIILSFFPEEEKKSVLSPIKFHLNMLAPKLFYWLSLKHSLDNRRLVATDARFSYFFPANIQFKDFSDEKLFYSYKSYALLNWYYNYNLSTILPVVTLITFSRFFDELPDENYSSLLKPILYWVNYILLLFLWHFKEYDLSLTKPERLKFMLKLLDEVIFYMEFTKDEKKDYNLAKQTTKKIMDIINKRADFVMFLYNITEELASIYEWKNINIMKLYEHFIAWMLMDFPSKDEFKWILNTTVKKIFVKRFSLYLDADIITLCNVLSWDNIHINYLVSPNNEDFLPYFAQALEYIWEMDLDKPLTEIIDKVLNFDVFGENLINALKDFNTDNVDIWINPDMDFSQVQEMLSQSMMDNVKKISLINEQFLDFLILLISRRLNYEWDNYQWELKKYKLWKIDYKAFLEEFSDEELKKLKSAYKILDFDYFENSYFYKTKKHIKAKDFYFTFMNVGIPLIVENAKKVLLEEYTEKWFDNKITIPDYFKLLKKYFYSDIEELLRNPKKYLSFYKNYSRISITDKQVLNFKKNIYYPDFLVYYSFLSRFKPKKTLKNTLFLSLLKQSLFGYLIAIRVSKNSVAIDNYYLEFLWNFVELDDDFFETLKDIDKSLDSFIEFFVKVKQNKQFVAVVDKKLSDIPENKKKYFIFDAMLDITRYNKRTIAF